MSDKYDEVLVPFVELMRKELHANSDKGDRPGWLSMSNNESILEIYYHVAKLQKAVRDRDVELIREHAADVANMAMMASDRFGLLNSTTDTQESTFTSDCGLELEPLSRST